MQAIKTNYSTAISASRVLPGTIHTSKLGVVRLVYKSVASGSKWRVAQLVRQLSSWLLFRSFILLHKYGKYLEYESFR